MKNKWHVITGAPCSGKTTVLKELGKMGFKVIYEAARIYIDRELKNGKSLAEIRNNELEFQIEILKYKINIEKNLSKEEITFFDRAIPDSIAYYRLCRVRNDPFLDTAVKNSSYGKVFLFELLNYDKGYSRIENREEAKKLEKLLKICYKEINLTPIIVPKMSVQERVDFILKNIQP